MTGFSIDELTIPTSLEPADPDAAAFIEMTDVRNEIEAATIGSRDLSYAPAELLPHWQDPYNPQRLLVARTDDGQARRIVGRGVYEAPTSPGSREVWLEVEVLEPFRGRGIGSALYEALLRWAAEDGRSVIQGFVLHAPADGPKVSSPTGFGSVPRDSAETRFVLNRGFRLEQVERMSRLALPLDDGLFSAAFAAATAAAGSDYRVIRWTGRTPEKWQAELAFMHQRMSTDAPSAGLDLAEEVWDEDRLRALDDRYEASPRTIMIAAVEHVPSGSLAGFTELSVPPEQDRAVGQGDLLVLKEHRGHRLGMLLKLANLAYLAETLPGHPAVMTFNAEENRHMLDVNEAVGFVPVAYGGGWKREV